MVDVRVLLINNGFKDDTEDRDYPSRSRLVETIKKFIPESVKMLKREVSILAPRSMRNYVFPRGFSAHERRFPIGLGYLSAVLKQHGHQVELVDRYAASGDWTDDIKSFDFVGVYVSTPFFHDALWILELLAEEGYNGPIAFGGPHATQYPHTTPPRVDYVVQGEAEYLINDLVNGVYPKGSILRTQRIYDLDALPRADYDLFFQKPRPYQVHFPYNRVEPIFNMNTSRSCPLRCTFCSVKDIWGKLFRQQSAERIYQDMVYLKERYKIAGVYFREDLFTANNKRVAELCEKLIKNDVGLIWACETRVDLANDEKFVALMARAGCRGFYVGAESGSQKMLDFYKKDITVDDIVKSCKYAKKYGIVVAMSLIVAHPEETFQDKLDTYRMVRMTKPEILMLNPYRDEFTRSGSVDYPTYEPRPVIDVLFENGTDQGQVDRMGQTRTTESHREEKRADHEAALTALSSI